MKGWKSREPNEPQHEAPELIKDSITALFKVGVTAGDIAKDIAVSTSVLNDLVLATDPNEQSSLLWNVQDIKSRIKSQE